MSKRINNKSFLEQLATKYATKPANIQARLIYLGYVSVCGRCGGTGKYSYNQIDGDRCYGCDGAGQSLKILTADDVQSFVTRVDAGELKPYFARNEAVAWCKRQSKAVFDVWGGTNVAKAYGPNWQTIEHAPEIYRRNSEMCQLQEEAHKIIDAYQYGKANIENATADKAKIEEILAKIKALDLPQNEVDAMMLPVLEAKRQRKEEMDRLMEERRRKKEGV